MASRNDAGRIEWLRKGAEQGNVFAQFNLGVAYLKGNGVERNFIEAFKWLYLAETRGYDDAPAIRDALQKKIAPDDLARARTACRQWQDDFEKRMKRKT